MEQLLPLGCCSPPIGQEMQSCLHPVPACVAVAVLQASEEHLQRSPARQRRSLAGVWGRNMAPATVALWQWGRWRLPGFWLTCAMEPGHRCRSSLCFKSHCCSKVIATLLAYF